jgi:hypothetical protein
MNQKTKNALRAEVTQKEQKASETVPQKYSTNGKEEKKQTEVRPPNDEDAIIRCFVEKILHEPTESIIAAYIEAFHILKDDKVEPKVVLDNPLKKIFETNFKNYKKAKERINEAYKK